MDSYTYVHFDGNIDKKYDSYGNMTFFIMMNHDLGYLWFQTHPIQTHRIPEDSGWIAQKGVPH